MRRGERGNVTGLVAVAMMLLAAIVGVVVIASAYRAVTHQAQGAADLAALAGGEAAAGGHDACAAAGSTAQANGVRITACTLVGDEIDFVVSVTVVREPSWRPLGLSLKAEAQANAGVLQDGP
ncbi:Rv3654c family TadE-like protein [Nigerium massiliense]|uniref:Rv3654c family TadE-like protein n=1 Tax=Nigerium massiliense TaxID=1522317 RepID=UPI00058FBBAB|nr:Rv3654c family TadE-like protein [Nigerium massiliense]